MSTDVSSTSRIAYGRVDPANRRAPLTRSTYSVPVSGNASHAPTARRATRTRSSVLVA